MPLQRVTMQPKCPDCGKNAIEVFRFSKDGKIAVILKCGHITVEEVLQAKENVHFESMDGYKPFDFQETSSKFAIESANGRVLFAHEPGLGKTICAFYTLALMGEDTSLPCLWIVKASLIPQFFTQIIKWMGYEHTAQVIENGHDRPFKGFKHYIVSYDLLHRLDPEHFKELGLKTVVLDECQMIKNFGAKRTKGVYRVCQGVPNIFALSGTPILNNAIEYFPVLHLLRPAKFPNRETYIRYWIAMYSTGRYNRPGGLRNPQKFKDYTDDFIIRFTKEEVLKDLPPINRGFQYCNMDDDLMESYNKILNDFGNAYAINPDMNTTNILAYMSKMRHLTGLAKIDNTIELVQEHLEDTERKLVVFVHHIDVGDIMFNKLKTWCKENGYPEPVRFYGGMNQDQVKESLDKFEGSARVMIASTLAAGEGLNLQFCSDCILHERQWNPPKEDQAFDRFHRIGQLNSVSARIMVALGTIDETLTDIVESKRKNLKEALDNKTYKWDETQLAKELAEAMFQRAVKIGLKREKIAKKESDEIMAEVKFVENLKDDLMKDVNEGEQPSEG